MIFKSLLEHKIVGDSIIVKYSDTVHNEQGNDRSWGNVKATKLPEIKYYQ